MRRNETTTQPIGIGGMPITLAQAKEHTRIRVSNTKQDALITLMIEAATTTIEGYVNKRYTDRAYELIFDCEDLTENVIELERFNDLITITSTTRTDEDNVSSVVPAADFTLIGRRVQLEDTFSDFDFRKLDSLIIEYSVLKVPASEEIKEAIKEFVSHMYATRVPVVIGTIVAEIPGKVMTLIQNERIWNV